MEPIQNTETTYLPLNTQLFTMIHAPQPWKHLLTTQIFYQEQHPPPQKKKHFLCGDKVETNNGAGHQVTTLQETNN